MASALPAVRGHLARDTKAPAGLTRPAQVAGFRNLRLLLTRLAVGPKTSIAA